MKNNEEKEEYTSASEFFKTHPDTSSGGLERLKKAGELIVEPQAQLIITRTYKVAVRVVDGLMTTRSPITRLPGYGMLRVIQGVCPPKFRERELAALMGDASEAFCQAAASGDKWGMRRLRLLTPLWVFGVALKGAASALLGAFSKAVKTGSE